jgi:hypothetical protein
MRASPAVRTSHGRKASPREDKQKPDHFSTVRWRLCQSRARVKHPLSHVGVFPPFGPERPSQQSVPTRGSERLRRGFPRSNLLYGKIPMSGPPRLVTGRGRSKPLVAAGSDGASASRSCGRRSPRPSKDSMEMVRVPAAGVAGAGRPAARNRADRRPCWRDIGAKRCPSPGAGGP